MKKLLAIILSITMLFSMGTVAFADGVDGPTQKAKLTVGINAEFFPFEYYDENGNLVIENKIGQFVENKTLELGNNVVLSEFNYADGDFTEDKVEEKNTIYFEKLEPAQWHIFRISNRG